MLGIADYHRFVPRDPVRNVAFRLKLNQACELDASLRSGIREVCRRDAIFFVNTFVWQSNPLNKTNEVGPFILFRRQEELVREIIETPMWGDEDLVVDKSREMGATWIAMMLEVWGSTFHPRKKFLDISHTADAVDVAEDPDCLFWKARFIHKRLPEWLLGEVFDKKMLFKYATDSVITGAASTGRSGVGGRATMILLDELAKQESASEIVSQTADTGTRLIISTHYGVGTKFAQLCKMAEEGYLKKFTLHWSHHPEKAKGLYRFDDVSNTVEILDKQWHQENPGYEFVTDGRPTGGPFPGLRSPWYDKQCRTKGRTSREIAQHLDIDPQGSDVQVFDALLLRQLEYQYAEEPKWEGDVVYDSSTGEARGLVKREGGPLKLWFDPGPGHEIPPGRYVFGGDIAAGVGSSPTCWAVGNADTGEQVGAYVSATMKPERMAYATYALGSLFKNAYVMWEANGGPGSMFADEFLELGYSNYHLHTNDKVMDLDEKETPRPGWWSNAKGKRLMIDQLAMALADRHVIVRQKRFYTDAAAFRMNKKGVPEHAEELSENDPSGAGINHGDFVIGVGLMYKGMAIMGLGERPKREEEKEPPLNSIAGRRKARHNGRNVRAF